MRNWYDWKTISQAGLMVGLGLGLSACGNAEFKQPLTLGGQVVQAATLNHGKEQYVQYCRPCHGPDGDGKGLSATGLRPPPRDFSQGLFKFGGVTAPALPPDSELIRIIRGGLHGTAMLAWDIPDQDLNDTIQYVKTFSPRWKEEKPGEPIQVSADPYGPSKKAAAIEMGKKIYHAKAQCSGCHPSYVTHQELYEITKAMTGTGMTTFSEEMYHSQPKDSEYCLEWKPAEPPAGAEARDKWISDRECAKPVRVVPPDFTRDNIRNVRLARNQPYNRIVDDNVTMSDLYRTIAAGIGGANMPTWKGALSEEELWGMAYYVKSLLDMNGVLSGNELHRKLADPSNINWVPPAPPPPAPEAPAPEGAAGAPPAGAAPAAAPPAAPTK